MYISYNQSITLGIVSIRKTSMSRLHTDVSMSLMNERNAYITNEDILGVQDFIAIAIKYYR